MTATTTVEQIDESQAMGQSKMHGRVAFVTGGTRGIGAAISKSLASQGATVAAGYSRNTEQAQKFLAELSAASDGAEVSVHQGDVGCGDDCKRTIREVIDRHGRLDILVNNAGITIDKTVAKMTEDEWNKVIAVNLSGAFFLAQAALAHMLERGSGRIVMVSSVIGEMGAIGQANYAASKAGLFGLTKTLARGVFSEGTRGHVDRKRYRRHGQRDHTWIRGDRDDRVDPRESPKPHQRHHPHGPAGPAVGDRTSGALPGRGCLRVHHRTGLGRQRRPGHVMFRFAPTPSIGSNSQTSSER
jgi:NADP-dependent 3-hydroxy acid dehydrogenase YdfG